MVEVMAALGVFPSTAVMVRSGTAAGAAVEAMVPVSPAVEAVIAMVAAVPAIIPARGAAIAAAVIVTVEPCVMPHRAANIRAPVGPVPTIVAPRRMAGRTGVTVTAPGVRAPGIMADRRLHARIDPAHDRRVATAVLFAWSRAAIRVARIAGAAIPATGRAGEVTARMVAARAAIASVAPVTPIAPVCTAVSAIAAPAGVLVCAALAAIEVRTLSAAVRAAATITPVAAITAVRPILSLRLDGRDIQQGWCDQEHGSSGTKQAKFSDCHRTRLRGSAPGRSRQDCPKASQALMSPA